MKSIAFKDMAGGQIRQYINQNKPNQKRLERIYEALEELKHTGNIIIYKTKGNKLTKLKIKST